MSYKVILESKVKAGAVNDLMPFLEANLPNVRGFKGCLSVDVLMDKENNGMVFYEEWSSKEDHANYMGFISDNGVLGRLAMFLEGAPDIKYFERLTL